MANYYLYIAYSISIDKYYIGETDNLERRLHEHNEHLLKGSFTTRATDWTILAFVEVENRVQARKLESFIKKQKSRRFIQSFIEHEEIRKSIIIKVLN